MIVHLTQTLTAVLPLGSLKQNACFGNDLISSISICRYRNLDPLEQKLQEVMVGQVLPIEAVAAAIRRRQNGWQDDDKPLVMLFLVPFPLLSVFNYEIPNEKWFLDELIVFHDGRARVESGRRC